MKRYRIRFHADVEGDWTDHPDDGRSLRFASVEAAQKWWDAHYRGPDDMGNQAHPEFVADD